MWSHVYSHKTIKIVPSLAHIVVAEVLIRPSHGGPTCRWDCKNDPVALDIRRMIGAGGVACLIKHKRENTSRQLQSTGWRFLGTSRRHRSAEDECVLAFEAKFDKEMEKRRELRLFGSM